MPQIETRPPAAFPLRFLGMFIAPTRAVVDLIRDKFHRLQSAEAISFWNAGFQIVALAYCFLAPEIGGDRSWTKFAGFCGMASLAVCRINELIYAFYRDAMDRVEGFASRSSLSDGARIRLLFVAYSEVVVQFAIVHYCAQGISHGKAYHQIGSIMDALYFSGVTITTTGFGDVYPQSSGARALTVFEAITGLLFVALTLAVYLSAKPKTKSRPATAASAQEVAPTV